MRLVCFAAALAASVSASPALADKYFAVTPSGATEALFPDKPQAAIGKLSSRCIDLHWTVNSSSTNELVCEAPLNFGQSLVGQMLMGNSYSTPPRRFFRFNVAEINGISRAQGSGWIELQMAFGQMRRTDFTGAQFHNNMMAFMVSAGGRFPPGTTFPNHAVMGIQGKEVPNGKFLTMQVTEVETSSAASKAGIQVGDVITKIAGKTFKNYDDYLDATAKAAASSAYDVELYRSRKPAHVTVERTFRPTWTEKVIPAVAEAPAAPAPVSPPTQFSIADELQKLAKLKESGLLTDTEFEAQKRKLLSQ